jgi:integrase
MRSLTIEQARALLKAAEGTKYGPVIAVALTTGMRPSEYLAVKWEDKTGPDKRLALFVASED